MKQTNCLHLMTVIVLATCIQLTLLVTCYLITAQLNLLQCFTYTMLYTSDILRKCL
jgi:hypothetical protein